MRPTSALLPLPPLLLLLGVGGAVEGDLPTAGGGTSGGLGPWGSGAGRGAVALAPGSRVLAAEAATLPELAERSGVPSALAAPPRAGPGLPPRGGSLRPAQLGRVGSGAHGQAARPERGRDARSGSVSRAGMDPGEHVREPCSRPHTRGQCDKCDPGTFTAFPNGLESCLLCGTCSQGSRRPMCDVHVPLTVLRGHDVTLKHGGRRGGYHPYVVRSLFMLNSTHSGQGDDFTEEPEVAAVSVASGGSRPSWFCRHTGPAPSARAPAGCVLGKDSGREMPQGQGSGQESLSVTQTSWVPPQASWSKTGRLSPRLRKVQGLNPRKGRKHHSNVVQGETRFKNLL